MSDEQHEVNRTISRTVKALLGWRGMEVAEFCAAVGIKEPTYYGRQRGTDWKAWEVQRAAVVLGVDEATLYRGLPHLDSNQKPADYPGDVLPFPLRGGRTTADGAGLAPVLELRRRSA